MKIWFSKKLRKAREFRFPVKNNAPPSCSNIFSSRSKYYSKIYKIVELMSAQKDVLQFTVPFLMGLTFGEHLKVFFSVRIDGATMVFRR